MDSVVVLPAPLGPSRPNVSPARISREMPRTASRLPKLRARSTNWTRSSAAIGDPAYHRHGGWASAEPPPMGGARSRTPRAPPPAPARLLRTRAPSSDQKSSSEEFASLHLERPPAVSVEVLVLSG